MTIEEKRKAVCKYCDGASCGNCAIRGTCDEIDEAWGCAKPDMVEGAYAILHPENESPKILDSGERTEYSTGAVRDCKEGKGRCDLMPLDVVSHLFDTIAFGDSEAKDLIGFIYSFQKYSDTDFLKMAVYRFWDRGESRKAFNGLLEVSKHFEEGAKKYGPNNWQKGIPIRSYIDSAVRHYLKYRAGWTDEPHDRAFVWNLMCCIWTMEHHPELDDFTEKGKKDNE